MRLLLPPACLRWSFASRAHGQACLALLCARVCRARGPPQKQDCTTTGNRTPIVAHRTHDYTLVETYARGRWIGWRWLARTGLEKASARHCRGVGPLCFGWFACGSDSAAATATRMPSVAWLRPHQAHAPARAVIEHERTHKLNNARRVIYVWHSGALPRVLDGYSTAIHPRLLGILHKGDPGRLPQLTLSLQAPRRAA